MTPTRRTFGGFKTAKELDDVERVSAVIVWHEEQCCYMRGAGYRGFKPRQASMRNRLSCLEKSYC